MDDLIGEASRIAHKNWDDWHDVFEHGNPIHTNPLLAEPGDRFSAFLREYSVTRTIRSGTHDAFRIRLREPQFSEVMRDDSGRAFDKFESHLRESFGTHEPKRRIISVLSKVAAFVKPERFVAWDQYARKGLNIVLHRESSRFVDYADYLAAFEQAWDGSPGQNIREYIARNGESVVETEPRFQRRVLDDYLMLLGGRWKARKSAGAPLA